MACSLGCPFKTSEGSLAGTSGCYLGSERLPDDKSLYHDLFVRTLEIEILYCERNRFRLLKLEIDTGETID